MDEFSAQPRDFSAGFHPGFQSKSMGMKLLLVGVLALLMTIPSFFVSGLVDERAYRAQEAAKAAGSVESVQQSWFGTTIRVADTYQSVTRSLKYVLLFLGLIFLSYFVFEATSGRQVHPAQYALVGAAQIIFFLLLLALAEKIGFDMAFLLAGGSTITLLSLNALWIFESRAQGLRALGIFSVLYGLIYVLLRIEDYALLIGAIASFLAVAAAMYYTRSIDWYNSPGRLSTVSGSKNAESR